MTYSMRATENRDILDGGAIERRDPKNVFTIYENKIRSCNRASRYFRKEHLNWMNNGCINSLTD